MQKRAAVDSKGNRRKKNKIAGQFAARTIAMLKSPAYRLLSRAAHMVLARLEIEHAHHGGNDNGKLPCTFAHFEEYGVHRRSIAPAIRELVALGFIEVMRKGAAGNAEFRQPSLYRLTYRAEHGGSGSGTHEYLKIATIEEATALADWAREQADPRAVAAGKKRNPGGTFCQVSVAESATETPNFSVAESATTGSV